MFGRGSADCMSLLRSVAGTTAKHAIDIVSDRVLSFPSVEVEQGERVERPCDANGYDKRSLRVAPSREIDTRDAARYTARRWTVNELMTVPFSVEDIVIIIIVIILLFRFLSLLAIVSPRSGALRFALKIRVDQQPRLSGVMC